MLFLLFGNRVVRKEAGTLDRTCPYCGVPGQHLRMEAENYFTLFFVPLFKVGKGAEQVKCRSCRQLFPIQTMVPTPTSPPPTTTWTCRTCANVNPSNSALCLKCKATPSLERGLP